MTGGGRGGGVSCGVCWNLHWHSLEEQDQLVVVGMRKHVHCDGFSGSERPTRSFLGRRAAQTGKGRWVEHVVQSQYHAVLNCIELKANAVKSN